jgi:NUMOD3 motif
MQFYAYLWLRIDGTPYYAGKGSGDRAFSVKTHKVKPPVDRSRIVIYFVLSEAEAFDLEMTLIAWYGRKDLGTGCLRNFTNGGEGRAGYKISETVRQRMGQSQKGNSNSAQYKRSEQGRQEARSVVQAHGLTFRGRKHSSDTRAKQSAAAKARWERVHAS